MKTAAIRTAARIARFSIVRPDAPWRAADHIRPGGMDGSGPDARPRAPRPAPRRAPRARDAHTPNRSARSDRHWAKKGRSALDRPRRLQALAASAGARARPRDGAERVKWP